MRIKFWVVVGLCVIVLFAGYVTAAVCDHVRQAVDGAQVQATIHAVETQGAVDFYLQLTARAGEHNEQQP